MQKKNPYSTHLLPRKNSDSRGSANRRGKMYSDLTTAETVLRSLALAGSHVLIFKMVQIFRKTNRSLLVLCCSLWSMKMCFLKLYRLDDNLQIKLALYNTFLFLNVCADCTLVSQMAFIEKDMGKRERVGLLFKRI